MSKSIDGKHVAQVMGEGLLTLTNQLVEQTGKTPHLAVIIVGTNPASLAYVKNKEKAAAAVGIKSTTISLKTDVSEALLLQEIKKLNENPQVSGILVQLPLPAHIDGQKVIRAIAVHKDVDGFHPEQMGDLVMGHDSIKPCTPAGILALLDFYQLPLLGQHTVIIGRSNIVGKPLAHLLIARDATVTMTHSKTPNLADLTRLADIVIVAIGVPQFLTADMVKPGAVVIDVGINRTDSGKLVGDVDFSSVAPVASHITPVPGGVGPMTIAMLLHNTVRAFRNQNNI